MLFGTEAIALLTRCSLSNPPDRSLVRRHNLRRQWSLLLARTRVRLQWPQRLKPSEIICVCRGSQGPTDRLSSDRCVEACPIGAHIRPTARSSPTREAVRSCPDPHQFGLFKALTAPHTGPNRHQNRYSASSSAAEPSSASATGPSPASSSAYSSSLTGASSAAAASSSCMAR